MRADTPAGGGQADAPAGAVLQGGVHACPMGEGGHGGSPIGGGREELSACVSIEGTLTPQTPLPALPHQRSVTRRRDSNTRSAERDLWM
jgi:hypothetical protein